MRPLPELTPANEWFWRSGADGKLRIQGCSDCGQLVHPPVPICPQCRSRASAPVEMSGRGDGRRRHGQRPAVPAGLRPRAAVRDRQRRPRGGPRRPAHHQHRRLRARRRAHRPGGRGHVRAARARSTCRCSRPTGGADTPDRIAEVRLPAPRPPVSTDRFEHRSVLSGIGRSKLGRRLMVDPLSLTIDACLAAVADAGLTLDDIDGLSTYPGMTGAGMSEGGVTAVEEALRIHPTWTNGGGDLPGPGRLGHRRDARGRVRAVPARAVLPDGLGVHLPRARPRPRAGPGVRLADGVARAVRGDVGRELDRA